MPIGPLHRLREHRPNIYNLVVQAFENWAFIPPANLPATVALPATPNGTWHAQYGELLGTGGQGLCHVWACIDNNNGKVLDRVVVKYVAGGRTWFRNPENWLNGNIGGEPREHWIARTLHATLAPNDRKYMVEPRGYSDMLHSHPDYTFKLYSEFAPVGSHYDLIESQEETIIPARRRGTHFGSGRRGRVIRDRPFTESFLWYLFQGLAVAADAMERAGIVHGDLQTLNVLFGMPDRNEFAVWPVPKVHDFGSSRFINTLPANNHRANLFEDLCCFAYVPPELSRFAGGWTQPNPATRLSGKTNVWQVGCLMLCAMRLEAPLVEANWHYDPTVPRAGRLDFTPAGMRRPYRAYNVNSNYSAALKHLVQQCVNYDPQNRPTAAGLLNRVRNLMVGRLDGQDAYAVHLPGPNAHVRILHPTKDPYKIGKKPTKRLR